MDSTRFGGAADAHSTKRFGEQVSKFLLADASLRPPLRFRRDQNIFHCGQVDPHSYLVVSGQVKARKLAPSGRACLVDIYTPNDVFGESCLVSPLRTETTTAMTATVLHKISGESLLSALSKLGLLEEYVRYLAQRLAEREETISAMATADCEHRLAQILLRLADKLGTRAGGLTKIEYPLTQQELADMVGTTRSRVGFFLGQFRAQGLVGPMIKGRITVREPAVHDYLDPMPRAA